jgi:protein gp37
MHPDWARKLRDQCNAAGVPFLFKQWGQFRPGGDAARPAVWINPDGSFDQSWEPTAGQTSMVKVGKHAAGRLLDGRTWDEYPAVVTA